MKKIDFEIIAFDAFDSFIDFKIQNLELISALVKGILVLPVTLFLVLTLATALITQELIFLLYKITITVLQLIKLGTSKLFKLED